MTSVPLSLNIPRSNFSAQCHSEGLKSLLAAIMVADKKLHKNELKEILTSLNESDRTPGNSDAKNRKWLKQNIKEISSVIHGPNRSRWLSLQFLKLLDYPEKQEALKKTLESRRRRWRAL